MRFRNRNLAGAESLLQPLVERTPDDLATISLLGSLHFAQGNANEGIKYLQKAVHLQPDTAMTHMRLGLETARP